MLISRTSLSLDHKMSAKNIKANFEDSLTNMTNSLWHLCLGTLFMIFCEHTSLSNSIQKAISFFITSFLWREKNENSESSKHKFLCFWRLYYFFLIKNANLLIWGKKQLDECHFYNYNKSHDHKKKWNKNVHAVVIFAYITKKKKNRW